MKRVLSVLLSLLMIVGILACLPVSAKKETILIKSISPAILADVGECVTLSMYDVQVSDSVTMPADSITWKKDSATIYEFTPSAAGVTKLVASDGKNTKNVYVVAKKASDTEYVLYENDFEGITKADLDKEGWVFLANSPATVSDGALHLGSTANDYARAILPAYIGDFSTYEVTAIASQTDTTNDSRWCSVVYHIENKNGSYYPYYHMCVRCNTTSSTIEFAERTTSNTWNVITSISKKLNMKTGYHKLGVKCFEETVQYYLDDESVYYTNGGGSHATGYAGLTSNYGIMHVDSVKVVLLMDKPERPVEKPLLIDTSANRKESSITSYYSNQAYVTSDTLNALLADSEYPVAALFDARGKEFTQAECESYLTACQEKNIIPELWLDTTAKVDLLNKAITATKVPEALVVGAPNIVKYARNKNKSVVRGCVDYTSLKSAKAFDIYDEAVGSYAQAVLLPAKLATKKLVADIQEYELAVWAFADSDVDATLSAAMISSGANAVVSSDWKKVAETDKAYFTENNSVTRTPVWTAHRGNHNTYPENSLSAYQAAIDGCADCLETDIHLTKDNVVVINHDDTIDRTYNGTGNIHNMTYDELLQYNLKNASGKVTDEVMPTFRELLQLCKGKDIKILCELKSSQTGLAKAAVALVEEYKMADQVVFISFYPDQLSRAKMYMNVTGGYLMSISGTNDAEDKIGTLNGYYQAQLNCLNYHTTMAASYSNVTYEVMRDAQDRGMTMWTWTYSAAALVCTNYLYGMNGETTDNITVLKDTIKNVSASNRQIQLKAVGDKTTFTLMSETYTGNKKAVTADAKVIMLDNDGVISVENGQVKGLKEGVASFMLSYTGKLPNGAKATYYSQPIVVYSGVECPEPEFIRGDVDGNGKVESKDYVKLKRYVLQTYRTDDEQELERMNVDMKGGIDSKDYVMLKRVVLGTYSFD